MPETLLVTGASGHFGQSVLSHLLDTLKIPADRVIATTRRPEGLAVWAERGIAVRSADFDNDDSLARAFAGANRILLISTDADIPGHRLRQHQRAIVAAEKSGVRHLTYTSMPDPGESLVLFAPDHRDTESFLRFSGLESWTVLRNHWYFENLLRMLPGILARGGKWFSAAGAGKVADIARSDLALAAACELSSSSQGEATYTLSGAEALTAAQQAKKISAVIGKQIQVIHVSPEDLIRGMVGAGVPVHFAALLASFDANVSVDNMAAVTDDFHKITGRQPQSFDAWLVANKAALDTL